jgi:hypothetical protein
MWIQRRKPQPKSEEEDGKFTLLAEKLVRGIESMYSFSSIMMRVRFSLSKKVNASGQTWDVIDLCLTNLSGKEIPLLSVQGAVEGYLLEQELPKTVIFEVHYNNTKGGE